MNTCSFTIQIKYTSACSTVFVKYIICFGEFKEAFPSFQHAPLISKAPPNTK